MSSMARPTLLVRPDYCDELLEAVVAEHRYLRAVSKMANSLISTERQV
mgnify:CR=1 FL=1